MPRVIYPGNKGRKAWNKGLKTGISPWLGKERSEETKEKIRKSLSGRVTKPDRFCLICGKNGVRKGRKFCSRECASVSFKGKKTWIVGKKHSAETIKKISGKNCHLWKGGITPINKAIRTSLKYREWREMVFQRDGYKCVIGGKEHGNRLNADHIKSFSQYPELRLDVNNGRTLCVDCHKKTDNYGGKKRI